MKKILFLFVFSASCFFADAQSLTLPELKAIKNVAQPEIIELPDEQITYPVRGLINMDIKSSLMGETIVEVEVWVVDAKGKIVYTNVFAAKDLSEKNFDPVYVRYMSKQGRKLLKRRGQAHKEKSRSDS